MDNTIILYIKSEKIPVVKHTFGVPGHPCTGADRAVETHDMLKPEDQEAKELLEKSGMQYRIIDLGESSFIAQIRAKITGINQTPTLIVGGKPVKGIENIRKILERKT